MYWIIFLSPNEPVSGSFSVLIQKMIIPAPMKMPATKRDMKMEIILRILCFVFVAI